MSNPTPTPADELVERVAREVCRSWGNCAAECPRRGGPCRGLSEYLLPAWQGDVARAVVALVVGEAAWQLSPVPTDRPIIGLPYTLDGMDASVTWWLQTEGRWANWHWSEPPIGWMPLPPDPDQSALIPEAKP